MSNIGSYTSRSFSENQKFLVLDPSTGTTSLVLGSDLVSYIAPRLNSVIAESTRVAAENTDYDVGEVIQTTGATSPGDDFAAVYLVVEGGTGDFPMLNGNDLLVIRGDEFLREQLISEDAGEGASLVSMEGGPTVETAVNNRVIRVSSVAEIESYSVPSGYQFSLESGKRSGHFDVLSGDFSTELAADTENGVYVGLADDPTALTKVAKRRDFYPPQPGFFGADGSGIDDQSGIDGVRVYTEDGDTIKIGKGTYVGYWENIKEQMRGSGALTVLQGDGVNPHVVQLGRHVPFWDFYEVEDLTVDGNARSCNGITYNENNQFANNWNIKNVSLFDCDIAIYKAEGNIGNTFQNVTYRQSNFGHKAEKGTVGTMHTGADQWLQCHWDNIDTACIAVDDDTAGLGQYAITDCIMEQCDGFGVFFKFNGTIPYIPSVIDKLWLEGVAQGGSVTIDAVSYTPRDMYFEGVVYQEIRSSYVKDIELVDSMVVAKGCRIDDASAPISVIVDSDSRLIMDDIYANGIIGGVPFVRSIANQINTSNLKNLGVRGPLKVQQMDIANYDIATNIFANSYSGAGPWPFVGTLSINATSVSDGVLNDTCAELTVLDGNTQQESISGTPTTGKYCVWSIHAKLVSGAFTRAKFGNAMNLGDIYLEEGKWVRSYGIQEIGTNGDVRIRFETAIGDTTVRLADMFCVEFDSKADAFEFVNSGFSLKNEI